MLDHLRFLDGLTSHEAVAQVKIHNQLPRVIREFSESNTSIKLLDEYPPKYAIASESMVWQHYGQRLFDLFDLRQPEIWKKYQEFLRAAVLS